MVTISLNDAGRVLRTWRIFLDGSFTRVYMRIYATLYTAGRLHDTKIRDFETREVDEKSIYTRRSNAKRERENEGAVWLVCVLYLSYGPARRRLEWKPNCRGPYTWCIYGGIGVASAGERERDDAGTGARARERERRKRRALGTRKGRGEGEKRELFDRDGDDREGRFILLEIP